MGLDVHILDLNEHLNVTPKLPFRLQSPSVTPLSQRFDWNNDHKELGKRAVSSPLETRISIMEDVFLNASLGKGTNFYHKGVNRNSLFIYTDDYQKIPIPELYNHHHILRKTRREVSHLNYLPSISNISSPLDNGCNGRERTRRGKSYVSWIPFVFVHQSNKSESEICFKRAGSLGNFELREQRRRKRDITKRMLKKLKRHLSTFW
jgi:hypothetical protein